MALLSFLISLLLALMALRGWPADSSVWLRSLLALAFLTPGAAALIMSRPAAKGSRLESVGGKGRWWLGALNFMLLAGLVYLTLALAPPAASQFSRLVVDYVREGLGGDGGAGQKTQDAEALGAANSSYETGALFDPQGAVVPKSAKLSPSKTPAVSLKMSGVESAERLHAAGQIYLHLFSHHLFDGERWTSHAGQGPLQLSCDSDGRIQLAQSDRRPDYRYTILHHELSSGLDALCTLQGVRYVSLPEITQLNAATWLLPRPDNAFGVIRPYQAASSPRHFRKLLEQGLAMVPGQVDPAHLAPSTDQELNLEIRRAAERFRSQPSLERQMSALQQWLAQSFRYSMDMDYADKQKSALESFLADPGRSEGFCVHFASAAVLILRELGVPARISYGWTGGEYYREHQQFVFEAEDGHAWAEIHLKDHGWVVFETTPESAVPQVVEAPLEAAPPELTTPMDEGGDDTAAARTRQSWPHWPWLLAALGVGAASAALALLIKRKGSTDSGPNDQPSTAGEPPGYLQLFYRTCAGLGHPKQSGQTLSRYLEQLSREDLPIPFADELLSYHYNVTYREAKRDARIEKRLRKWIKAL